MLEHQMVLQKRGKKGSGHLCHISCTGLHSNDKYFNGSSLQLCLKFFVSMLIESNLHTEF